MAKKSPSSKTRVTRTPTAPALAFSIQGSVHGVSYVPHGDHLLVSGFAGLHLLDARSGAIVRSYRGYTGVTSWYSASSPDGRYVLAGFGDCSLQLYDARTGALARELSTISQRRAIVSSVAFSADSRWALSGDFVKRMSLWDVDTGSELQRIELKSSFSHRVAFVGPQRALTGGYDKSVRLWDLTTGKELAKLGSHEGYVQGLAVTPDGARAVTGGRDRLVKVWDVARGVELAALEGHRKQVLSTSVDATGSRALSCSSDGSMILWDLGSMQELATFQRRGDASSDCEDVAFAPDGRHAAMSAGSAGVFLFELPQSAAVMSQR